MLRADGNAGGGTGDVGEDSVHGTRGVAATLLDGASASVEEHEGGM
jgi:hypothetical protein